MQSENNFHINYLVAFQKYLTELNNLLAVKVIANQTVVHANATARSNVARANGESQAIRIMCKQLDFLFDYSNETLSSQMGSRSLPDLQIDPTPK